MVLLGALWLCCTGRAPPRNEYEQIADAVLSNGSDRPRL
jgi:hypothetical protein